ncbi:MAG: hypothetical protein KKA31_03595, partial [Candidatus Margulisbacteria bacterium]|nr:hypothetical protein [Candidatus Margulisiibacteriota bacterium]
LNKAQIRSTKKQNRFGTLRFLISILFIISYLEFNVCAMDVDINGYYENDGIALVKRTGGGVIGDLNKLRLRMDYQPHESVLLHLEPQYEMLIASETNFIADASGLDQLVWDRAYLKYSFPQADLTVGKQHIAWGTGYIWNPTDVLNPFTLSFAVSEEDEEDAQAIRVQVPLGAASGIDAFILTNKPWPEVTKAIKAKTNLENYDVSASYVDLGNGGFQVGFDTSGELWEFGVRSEIALVSPAGVSRYFKSVWGGNYTFENGWGIELEYFFNGLGKKKKEDYDWTNYLAGNINQLGMDYIFLGLNKNLDELTSIRLSYLANADDYSYIFYPAYNRNIFEHVDLSLEAMITGGQGGSEYMPTDARDPTGLIGSKIVFVKLQYNF